MADIIDKYSIPFLKKSEEENGQNGQAVNSSDINFLEEGFKFNKRNRMDNISNWGDDLSRLGLSEIGYKNFDGKNEEVSTYRDLSVPNRQRNSPEINDVNSRFGETRS